MYRAIRERVYELFTPEEGGRIGVLTDWAIMLLIALNVGAVMIETVDSIASAYRPFFRGFELFSVAVFTVEYLGRIWSSVEDPEYGTPIIGRLRFAAGPLLIVDLLAILPFYLTAFGVTAELRFLRALRLVRFLRLLKFARYSESLQSFGTVFRRKRDDLVVALFINLILLVTASSAMYFVEHAAQPEAFSSIPETLWWGVVTLTTVGYGDVTPVTPLGRLLGAVTAALGIGLFALPASILASGFLEETSDDTHTCPHCDEEIDPRDLE
jgi:voltage-gated potassium channel